MKRNNILKLSLTLNFLFVVFIAVIGFIYLLIFGSYSKLHKSKGTDKVMQVQWPQGKVMALSFTFDDACVSQIDSAIPIFDKYNVNATFYVSLSNLRQRLDDWRIAISKGHEIGNHTFKHPCSLNSDIPEENSLVTYSLSRMEMELYYSNQILTDLLGISPVSFAYPCGLTYIGTGKDTKSYVPLISVLFESGRLYDGGIANPALCDMAQLPAEKLDDRSYTYLKDLIDTAREKGRWLILVGHEVGDGVKGASGTSVIEELCKYATDPANGIWVDNIHNVASYVKGERGDKPFSHKSVFRNPVPKGFSRLLSKYYSYRNNLTITEKRKKLRS